MYQRARDIVLARADDIAFFFIGASVALCLLCAALTRVCQYLKQEHGDVLYLLLFLCLAVVGGIYITQALQLGGA